ncbi:hypothetical protein LPJ79_000410 [Coemansia sp. RSA 1821]|nr:hypothetical protein LPJ68_000461 [Coemansia sp. RSA 1086]KAJ1753323.1 hypothetical protein LPJ79_000410 [Coemansia sp. RSA 1821]
MKTRASVLVAALWAATVYQCCAGIVALAPSDAYVRQIAPAASEHQAQETFRMPMLLKRKQEKEDPANPVAAAATDPNEAAMKIKSRDLVPTDRPGVRPEIHHHRHTDESKDEEHHNADSEEPEDEHDSDEHRSSPPHKASKSKDTKEDTKPKKPKSNDKNNNKDKDKDKDKGKEKGKSKNSKTHTGLDGKEVDDEDSDEMEARRKKIQVQHIQAKRRKWRTGRPKYDYKQAIAGWKEVGPMYYYKGKYENDASRLSSSVLAIALLGMI